MAEKATIENLTAQDFIRQNLPDYIPSSYKEKPFWEIANYKDDQGNNVGVKGLHEAWLKCNALVTDSNPLNVAVYGQQLRDLMVDLASLSSGSGLANSQLQEFMLGIDRFGKSMIMPNIELRGPTFFTRPRLCFQSSNLRNNPVMAPLDTANPMSTAFAIRALLDTNLANKDSKRSSQYAAAIANCPLINSESPWLTPLSNALTSISGFPDFDLQAEATEGGFFSEQQQYAVGSDDFNRGGAVQCSFREIPGSIISALFFYWLEYMRCVVRGDMLAYADDIDGQILNYTVSIYSFNMDPSSQYITRWVKCTGCFPKNLAVGGFMNKSTQDFTLDNTKSVDVSFVVNKFEYMNPLSLNDFNVLAMKYCPEINERRFLNEYDRARHDKFTGDPPTNLVRTAIPDSPFANFCGLPYIVSDPNGYRLVYRHTQKDLFNDPVIRKLIATDIARTEQEWTFNGKNSYSLYQQYDYSDFYENDVQAAKMNGLAGANILSFDQIIEEIRAGKFIKTAEDYEKMQKQNQAKQFADTTAKPGTL